MPNSGNIRDKTTSSEDQNVESDNSRSVFYSTQFSWDSRPAPSAPIESIGSSETSAGPSPETMSAPASGETTPAAAVSASAEDLAEFLSLRDSGEGPPTAPEGSEGQYWRAISTESMGSLVIDGRVTKSSETQVIIGKPIEEYFFRPNPNVFPSIPPLIANSATGHILTKDAETYELEKFSSNEMYIFNHFEIDAFKDKEPRLGTETDVRALQETFAKFGFKVRVFPDYTKQQIFDSLKELSASDLSQTGCIMVVVLSHGEENGMIFAKDDTYHESKLMNIFHVADNPTLNGKPIAFFVQACRYNPMGQLRTDARQLLSYTMPEEADMLLLHSTYHGKVSMRHTTEGSWFIQELCRKINNYHFEDLQSIVTRVQRSVAIEKEYRLEDKNNAEVIIKQMPVCMTTLTRKLHLVLKLGSQADFALQRIEEGRQFHQDIDLIIGKQKEHLVEDEGKAFRETVREDIDDGLDQDKESLAEQKSYSDDEPTPEPPNTEEGSPKEPLLLLAESEPAAGKTRRTGRSYSAGDSHQSVREATCAKCAVLGNEARLGCISHFDYLWKIFTNYLEKGDGEPTELASLKIVVIKDIHEILDRQNVRQIKLLSRYLVEYFIANFQEWPAFPFLYFGEYFVVDGSD